MRPNVIKLSFVGIAVIGVALMLAAVAVAQPGDDDRSDQSTESPSFVSTEPAKTPDATDEATRTAPSSPTDFAAPPADASDPRPGDNLDSDSPADDGEDDAPGSIEGSTLALNPGGHCVELPNDSDVVQNPDKHPNWIMGGCEPGELEPPDGEDPPGEANGPPEGRTPSLNPAGACVDLPNNSDIVRNPDKHPNWAVGGCELAAE